MLRESILEEVLLNLYSYLYIDDDGSLTENTKFRELEMDDEEIVDFVVDFEDTFECVLSREAKDYQTVGCLVDAICDAINE